MKRWAAIREAGLDDLVDKLNRLARPHIAHGPLILQFGREGDHNEWCGVLVEYHDVDADPTPAETETREVSNARVKVGDRAILSVITSDGLEPLVLQRGVDEHGQYVEVPFGFGRNCYGCFYDLLDRDKLPCLDCWNLYPNGVRRLRWTPEEEATP